MNVQRCVDVAQMSVDGAFRHEKLLLDALSRVALRVKNHDFRGAVAQLVKRRDSLGQLFARRAGGCGIGLFSRRGL